jgi:hypothetical protein
MRRLWDLLIQESDLTVEIVGVRDVGPDHVLAQVIQHGRSVSGMGFHSPLWVPSRWRKGECVWWGIFLSQQDALNALEAAGLRV